MLSFSDTACHFLSFQSVIGKLAVTKSSTMAPIQIWKLGALIALLVGVCVVLDHPSEDTCASGLSSNEGEPFSTELGLCFCKSAPAPAPKSTATQLLYTPAQIDEHVAPSVAYISVTLQGFRDPYIGSGFLWDRHSHVVTNWHVAMPPGDVVENIKVKLHGMHQPYDAIVVGVQPNKDLAVLKIQPGCLPQHIDVGTSADVQE
jgi:S1-C subfamily serine protease